MKVSALARLVWGYRLTDLAGAIFARLGGASVSTTSELEKRRTRVRSGLRAMPYLQPSAGDARIQTADELLQELQRLFPLVLLGQSNGRLWIGARDVDAISILAFIEAKTESLHLKEKRGAYRFGDYGGYSRVLTARSVTFSVNLPANRTPCWIKFEVYTRRADGSWLSRNSKNAVLRALYDDVFDAPGLVRAEEMLGAPTLSERRNADPVDVVYTWVNHDDPDWKELYQLHSDNKEIEAKKTDAQSMSRFHSNNELQFSLRSVNKHLPWVRKIYVLTNCAPPPWIDTKSERIIWVRHEDVIPSKILPTFSSHVIESYLHRLDGISDRFIYLNDDVFIGRFLKKSYFFNSVGHSRAFLERFGMVSGEAVPGAPDYLNASRNSASLLRDEFGFSPTRLHAHTPFALSRDVLAEIEEKWLDRFDIFRGRKFRSMDDLNLVSFLYHHYAIATGRARAARTKSTFINHSDPGWRTKIRQLQLGSIDTFCINDGGVSAPPEDWNRLMFETLNRLFPEPAEWERSDAAQVGRS